MSSVHFKDEFDNLSPAECQGILSMPPPGPEKPWKLLKKILPFLVWWSWYLYCSFSHLIFLRYSFDSWVGLETRVKQLSINFKEALSWVSIGLTPEEWVPLKFCTQGTSLVLPWSQLYPWGLENNVFLIYKVCHFLSSSPTPCLPLL